MKRKGFYVIITRQSFGRKVMKKNSFFLLIIIVMLLQACAPVDSGKSEDTSTPATSDTEKEMLVVACGGETDFEIIRPDEINGAESHLFTSFYREFNERYSCKIESTSDIMALIKPPAPDAKEILLGNTNREESKLLSEKLADAGGNRFGIMATDCKIVINGTSWYQCYLALDYFFSTFSSSDEYGNITVALECGFEYISDPSEDSGFLMSELLAEGRGIAFAATEKVLKFKNVNGAATVQGGCTDGEFVFVGMMGKGSDGVEYGVISKYSLATGEVIKSSEKLPLYHTNDLTYDAKNNRIVVATLDSGWTRLSIVDADSLEHLGDVISPVPIRGLEYLPETNQYVAAGFDVEIMLLDENFNKLSSHICKDTTLMTQGLYSDGEYVYDPRYLEGRAVHLMVVEDMNGELISSANIYGLNNAEPEHAYKIDGTMYIGCNHSGWLFKIDVIPQNWW